MVPAALHLALMFFCSSFLFAHLQEYSASSLPVFEKVTADDSEDNKRVVLVFFFFLCVFMITPPFLLIKS